MQRGHVDVAAIRLHRAGHPARAQAGNVAGNGGPIQALHPHPQRGKAGGEIIQRGLLPLAGDGERAARAQNAEPMQNGARGGGERLHQRPAIALRPEGGGTAGGVIAWVALRLQQQDARGFRRGGQGRRQRGPGHAGADNRDVSVGHVDGGSVDGSSVCRRNHARAPRAWAGADAGQGVSETTETARHIGLIPGSRPMRANTLNGAVTKTQIIVARQIPATCPPKFFGKISGDTKCTAPLFLMV